MESSFSLFMEKFSHPFSDSHITRIGSSGVSTGKKVDSAFILLAVDFLFVYSWSDVYSAAKCFP